MMTVYLEFVERETGMPRVFGTDVIFYRDGRWNEQTFRDKCRERAHEMTRARGRDDLMLVGYSIPHFDRVVLFDPHARINPRTGYYVGGSARV